MKKVLKKAVSILLSLCFAITGMPFIAYAVSIMPEIPFEDFMSGLHQIQSDFDSTYAGEMVFENDSEFFKINGEIHPIVDENGNVNDAVVSDDEFDIPLNIIEENAAVKVSDEISLFNVSDTIDSQTYAQALGYNVEINNGTAVLYQPYQTNRLIVKSHFKIDKLDSIASVEGYNDLHILQFDSIESTLNALDYYDSVRTVEYVEPDSILSANSYDGINDNSAGQTLSNSYGNHLSWGSESIGVDDYIDYLGNIEDLPQIVVGIIDTGVDTDHSYLARRIIQTGFNTSTSGSAYSEEDDFGHGTHVAGIIVDNTTENVKIKSYKVLNNMGSGSVSSICLAIDKAVEDGVNIINMSLGGPDYSVTMIESVHNAIETVLLFVYPQVTVMNPL